MSRNEWLIAIVIVALVALYAFAEISFTRRWQAKERREHAEFLRDCRSAGGHPVRDKCVFLQPVREVTP